MNSKKVLLTFQLAIWHNSYIIGRTITVHPPFFIAYFCVMLYCLKNAFIYIILLGAHDSHVIQGSYY